jgi:hypothetical protein
MTTLQYFKSLAMAMAMAMAMALRQRKLSGDKSAEVLRELQSHLQETGQSPEAAFGSPKEVRGQIP